MKKRSVAITAAVLTVGMISTSNGAFAADKPVYLELVSTATAAATLTPIATAGDVVGGKTIAGVPDGMGAYKNSDGTITLLSNHEMSVTNTSLTSDDFAVRTQRAFGGYGAYVSKFTLNATGTKVLKVDEAIKKMNWYNYDLGKYGSAPVGPAGAVDTDAYSATNHSDIINRLCSAYLAPAGALLGTKTTVNGKSVSKGWAGPLFFTGEEGSDESRMFVLDPKTSVAYQLPRIGLAAWENGVVASKTGDDTVVFSSEDGEYTTGTATVSPATATAADLAKGSQLWLYRGTKTAAGSFADRAGLTNGYSSVMKIEGVLNETEFRTKYPTKGTKVTVTFPEVNWAADGLTQNIAARLAGTSLGALEDIAINPVNKNELWFTTKSSGGAATAPSQIAAQTKDAAGNARDGGGVWKITFEDIAKPQLGAKIELVLDGSEAGLLNMPDNLDFDSTGRYLMIQEDPGKNAALTRLLAYDTTDKKIAVIAQFKKAYHSPTETATFLTLDEESSGIINVTSIFGGTGATFFLNAQIHPLAGSPVINAENAIAKETTKLRPDLTFADSDAEIAFKTKVIEGGQYYKLQISDFTKLTWL